MNRYVIIDYLSKSFKNGVCTTILVILRFFGRANRTAELHIPPIVLILVVPETLSTNSRLWFHSLPFFFWPARVPNAKTHKFTIKSFQSSHSILYGSNSFINTMCLAPKVRRFQKPTKASSKTTTTASSPVDLPPRTITFKMAAVLPKSKPSRVKEKVEVVSRSSCLAPRPNDDHIFRVPSSSLKTSLSLRDAIILQSLRHVVQKESASTTEETLEPSVYDDSSSPSIHRTLSFSSISSDGGLATAAASSAQIDNSETNTMKQEICCTPTHVRSDDSCTTPSSPRPVRLIEGQVVFPESLWLPFV